MMEIRRRRSWRRRVVRCGRVWFFGVALRCICFHELIVGICWRSRVVASFYCPMHGSFCCLFLCPFIYQYTPVFRKVLKIIKPDICIQLKKLLKIPGVAFSKGLGNIFAVFRSGKLHTHLKVPMRCDLS